MAFGNYGLDERPLLVGEVHDVIQNLYPLLSMSGQTMGIYVPLGNGINPATCAAGQAYFRPAVGSAG